jgi:uncharacterized protein
MTTRGNRRTFLAAAGLTVTTRSSRLSLAIGAEPANQPTLDLHVHLFGLGEGGTGCRMSRAVTGGLQFRLLKSLLQLEVPGKTLDARYEEVLAEQVRGSGLSKAAILGQDAVYDAAGKPDWAATSFYVPNDYVFQVVARHAETMIACPSINPNRADALDELARCQGRGARLFKIHPPTQGVDLADRKHVGFFRRVAELRMVVLVHTGHEHSAPVIDKNLSSPRRLERALDAGCTVVACHAGTGWASDSPDMLPEFVALVERYPNLWGDTAVLGTFGRVRDVERLLAGDLAAVRRRLLHGSDFPFPAVPAAYAPRIRTDAAERLGREINLLKRDFELKEALGIGTVCARRGYQIAHAASTRAASRER